MRGRSLAVASVLILTILSGCASSPADLNTDPDASLQRVFDLSDDVMSHTLVDGIYDILPPISQFVDIALPATEGGAALDPDGAQAHMGVFFPDIPGCDFDTIVGTGSNGAVGMPTLKHSDHTAAECRVPIVADVGPYWGESDVPADQGGSGRLGETLIQNLVPHGYAVAQISVLGSGKSDHCFDMFGLAEQLGVVGAVEWLGDQDWSNGNVGLIGRSYDGSTPWMAAAHAGPDSALKTIVPISGLSGLQDLVTWNGASEARVLTFHNVIYGTFGLQSDPATSVRHTVTCPDWLTAAPMGAAAYAKGDDVAEGTYWEERNFVPRTLENYEGSLFMIHGLLDGNVDPHAGWVAHQKLAEAGFDTKGLYGQWQHNYPDRWTEHGEAFPSNSVRFDWAQNLLEWFDFYLKGIGEAPALDVEVQQHDGRWRKDDSLTPSTAEILELPVVAATGNGQVSPSSPALSWNFGAVDADNETLLGGLSHVAMTVTPTGPGGQIHISLHDATSGSRWGLSYGIAELRHAPGAPDSGVIVPGVPVDIQIPLQYFAGALEPGHNIGVTVSGFGDGFLPSPVVEPVLVDVDSVRLHLSTIPAEDAEFFSVPERGPSDE